MAKRTTMRAAQAALRRHALALPGTVEERPWDHPAFKVRGKAFLFMGDEPDELGVSVKLGTAHDLALGFDFAEPTGYGLGKAGWVSATFADGDDVPLDLLLAWVDESYRLIAPKRLVAELDGAAPAKAATTQRAPKAAAAKRPAAKKKAARRLSGR